MHIIAHHGNVSGPYSAADQGAAGLESCLARGWGIELDLKRAPDGRFQVSTASPSPASGESAADELCAVLRRHRTATAVFNVVTPGGEDALIRYLRDQLVLGQIILAGLESIEATPGAAVIAFRALDPHVRIATRVSDRHEPVERALGLDAASVVWLDECGRRWATARDVRRLQNQGKVVYGASPDLHGFPFDVARQRWDDFMRWGVDGVCTSYPGALANTVRRLQVTTALAS